ncbi:MAG: DUF4435 domain-containing protein [Methanomassiliicoccaceae archaeon]|nr:DUF4435 domain-containing protein [Methanomassiliicoccaceae archaeon]
MRDTLTPADIANEISMLMSSVEDTVLVVEGVTDSRLYGKFSDKDHVKIVVGHSKDNVRKSVDECWSRRGLIAIVGIVDSDLDRIVGKKRSPPIFQTDRRDLEMMMIGSPALDDILCEYADAFALEDFESKYGPIFDAVVSACYPVGLLMYISDRLKLSLSFRNLDFERFIDRRTLQVDIKQLVNEVISSTMNVCIGKNELLRHVTEEMTEDRDPIDFARGHDAVEVLLIGLKYIFGSFNSKNLREGELSGSLRLAFSDVYFHGTDLYSDTSDWAKKQCFKLWSLNLKV